MLNKNVLPSVLSKGFNTVSNLSITLVIALLGVLGCGMINNMVTYKSPRARDSASKDAPFKAYSKPRGIVGQNLWKAPSVKSIQKNKEMILYGKELIVNTAKYLGPKGSVKPISNGLNCQNCHLAGGTQPFGNNYGGVASTYPKLRHRPGKIVDIPERINACFQRSLNGSPLPLNSTELKAMVAYMKWLGKGVPKGIKPKGAGLYKIAYLNRAASPEKGKVVYLKHCERCHGSNGEGLLKAAGISYKYPPLWGANSYNISAGLYRVGKFARFIKTNMPYGTSFKNIVLSDEEAWDIAAYVNTKPHPTKKFKEDWATNLINKPLDAPFGPYVDEFTEKEHKYGPYPPIQKAIQKLKKTDVI
ncbi:MAG: Cytochrome c family protein [uncultured Aureispira sp.]|uniref:Cytochrome c family protein n=1 Tax=uncultured Aureispira sp. TaxID=1331704 RepID=A0A6S6SHK5_9BACT|nr:MAG: Cytochrome c family protein [uncultured Aureispira sp.]